MKKILSICSLSIFIFSCSQQNVSKPIERITSSSEGLYNVDLTILPLDSNGHSRDIVQYIEPERLKNAISLGDNLPFAMIEEPDGELSWVYLEPGVTVNERIIKSGYTAVVKRISEIKHPDDYPF